MERYQQKIILKDLRKKMVLLAGPRQAGKTTLAKAIARHYDRAVYLNFDRLEDRSIIESQSWLSDTQLLILDEIHKMANWKNYLKGLYDTKPSHQQVLVTGSARLEIFNQVGDSLAGRFYLHRLLPLSPSECRQEGIEHGVDRFLERGGFPEPFLDNDPVEAKRWRLQYVDSLLQTDIFEFDNIHNVKSIRLVFDLLRKRVGSPVSYSSLAEDVGVAPNTIKKYIQIFEALYIVFRVTPYSNNIARSLLKEPKIYFFDTGLVDGDIGARFENLVAICLLKQSYAKVDMLAENYALHYLRTKEGLEVDFAIVHNNVVEQMIEVKYSDSSISPSLRHFHTKYQIPAIQVVKDLKRERSYDGIHIESGSRFLEGLYL